MTKKVFIDEVRAKLKGLSEDEISKALEFYEEAIDAIFYKSANWL